MANLAKFYLDPRGRISRKDFWFRFVLVGAVLESVLGTLDAIWRSAQAGEGHLILHFGAGIGFPFWNGVLRVSLDPPFMWIGAVLWLWPQVVIFIKRLHDLKRPAWWLGAVALVSAMVQGVVLYAGGAGLLANAAGTPTPMWYALVGLAVLLGGIAPFLLGVLPGQEGRNRYGDDPLEPWLPEQVPEGSAD